MSWYGKITKDLSTLPDFILFYEKELTEAKKRNWHQRKCRTSSKRFARYNRAPF